MISQHPLAPCLCSAEGEARSAGDFTIFNLLFAKFKRPDCIGFHLYHVGVSRMCFIRMFGNRSHSEVAFRIVLLVV